MDAARARKLADRISQIVAEMLERRIKDPRLGFVTVTEARLTNDLREATVYYTVLGTDAERADTAMALASATGVIRSEVGRQIGLRHTPSLAFVADALPDSGSRNWSPRPGTPTPSWPAAARAPSRPATPIPTASPLKTAMATTRTNDGGQQRPGHRGQARRHDLP
jgi:ribosome-binding factor A